MTLISLPLQPSTGAIIQQFPRAQYAVIKSIIDRLNSISSASGVLSFTSASAATLTATTSLTTPIISPGTAGSGTSIQSPVIAGTAYASPTVLTASQSGAICLLNAAAGNVFTLPAATAANVGVTFKFIQTATVTSNAAIIQGASSSDLFIAGSSIMQQVTATPAFAKYAPNGSSNYKVSGNGSTTGGIIGDQYTVVCTGLNAWLVNGTQTATGSVATPFAG